MPKRYESHEVHELRTQANRGVVGCGVLSIAIALLFLAFLVGHGGL